MTERGHSTQRESWRRRHGASAGVTHTFGVFAGPDRHNDAQTLHAGLLIKLQHRCDTSTLGRVAASSWPQRSPAPHSPPARPTSDRPGQLRRRLTLGSPGRAKNKTADLIAR